MKITARMRRITAAGLASFGVAGALMLTASPATAASPVTETTGAAQHCAVNLQTGKGACAADEAQATRLAEISAQSVRAVRLYDPTNYREPSVTYYVPAPCTPAYDPEYGIPNLGSWSNRASSLITYNKCDAHLHDGTNYTGAVSSWIDRSPNLANIGSGWSNRASSIGVS